MVHFFNSADSSSSPVLDRLQENFQLEKLISLAKFKASVKAV